MSLVSTRNSSGCIAGGEICLVGGDYFISFCYNLALLVKRKCSDCGSNRRILLLWLVLKSGWINVGISGVVNVWGSIWSGKTEQSWIVACNKSGPYKSVLGATHNSKLEQLGVS